MKAIFLMLMAMFFSGNAFAYQQIIQKGAWTIHIDNDANGFSLDTIIQSMELGLSMLEYTGISRPELFITTTKCSVDGKNNDTPAMFTLANNQAKIFLSLDGMKATTAFKQGCDLNTLLSIYATHEITHFFQWKTGANIQEAHAPTREYRLEKLENHPLEVQANSLAMLVALKKFNLVMQMQ